MLFMRDGTLLVTVGDRDRFCCDGSENTSQRMKAQTLDNHYGKILRIRDDGSIPPDNPFVGRQGARPEIYTYGHRNAYGLAYNPGTGELWESEIGPLGGDEVNILHAGHNYGWPLVSTGRNYTGTPVSDRPWTREGMDDPRMFWNPVISPSGLIFYTGDRFKGWKGNAFLGALNGKALWRVSLDNPKPQQVEQREVLLSALDVRVRDVQQGPDGNLYIATERGIAGVNPDGTVMRIEPAP
jgi:glucose/arabinose dehydrogenase